MKDEIKFIIEIKKNDKNPKLIVQAISNMMKEMPNYTDSSKFILPILDAIESKTDSKIFIIEKNINEEPFITNFSE